MPTAPSGLTLVHLSDLQFGRNHRFGRLGLASPDDTFDSLLSRVTTDFSLLSRESGLKPDAVVVTGDIAEHAKPSEYRDASSFVTGVLNHLGLALDRLIVVPGNHDISRSACEAYFKHCESVEETPAAPFYPKWQNFAAFLDATFGAPARFTPLATWSVHPIDSLGVVFACMNSTVRESHRSDDHYGWLGESQLSWFADQLDSFKRDGWLCIGLVHHNVMRGAEQDDENLRDADDLVRVLGDRLHVLLHGHTHQARVSWLGPRLPVVSTGSAAVVSEARPHEVPNQYQVVVINDRGLWLGSRQYAPDQKRWIGDTRVSPGGDTWWHVEPIAVDATKAFRPPSGTREVSASAAAVARFEDLAARVRRDLKGTL